MATNTMDTTSAGMPAIPSSTAGLDQPIGSSGAASLGGPPTGTAQGVIGEQAQKMRASATDKVRGIADEGKAQVTQTLDGIVEAARDIATKLEQNGAGPIARYAHQAADLVQDWSSTVDQKSVEDLVDDARTLVRTSPAIAVGVAVTIGFALSRFLKATSPTSVSPSFRRSL